jgi:hypothetical protein
VDLDQALDRAMKENALAPWHRETARGLLESPPDRWECCGGSCDPCVLVLQRVVERARRLMQSDA